MWVLRYILHDWNDGDAARILAALRGAMGGTPVTLCIVEARPLNRETHTHVFQYHTPSGVLALRPAFHYWLDPGMGPGYMAVCVLAALCIARVHHACRVTSSRTLVSLSTLCLLEGPQPPGHSKPLACSAMSIWTCTQHPLCQCRTP